jgi:hypothetical protein
MDGSRMRMGCFTVPREEACKMAPLTSLWRIVKIVRRLTGTNFSKGGFWMVPCCKPYLPKNIAQQLYHVPTNEVCRYAPWCSASVSHAESDQANTEST